MALLTKKGEARFRKNADTLLKTTVHF